MRKRDVPPHPHEWVELDDLGNSYCKLYGCKRVWRCKALKCLSQLPQAEARRLVLPIYALHEKIYGKSVAKKEFSVVVEEPVLKPVMPVQKDSAPLWVPQAVSPLVAGLFEQLKEQAEKVVKETKTKKEKELEEPENTPIYGLRKMR